MTAVIWIFSSYTLIIVLWDKNGACSGIRSLVAVRMPEVCFRPAKPGKKVELFEIRTCLWPSAPMLFRHNLLKLDAAFLSLLCIHRYSCLRCWNDFFLTVFYVLDWNFFLLLFAETFAIGFQICFDHKWIKFGVLFLISGFIGWFWFWIDKNLQKFWNLCLIWRHKVFSTTSFRVIPVCCSNVLVLCSPSSL